ncbi:MAG: sporulation initiation factor Spo0A C-terminal domain-containing protein [Ruminococcus flavefaciens]|nr:sporulation initiation factor Spo0A C-terminal domain-containing protein [Ruminococcus flavefaciens]
MSIETITSQALLKLGITPCTKGYYYILKALIIYNNSENFSQSLYPEIACRFNISPLSVERAIRTTIHSGYMNCDTDFAFSIFGNSLQSENDIPTNTLFISALSEWIKNQ